MSFVSIIFSFSNIAQAHIYSAPKNLPPSINECFPQTVHFQFAGNQFQDSLKYDSAKWDFADPASGQLNYATTFFTSHTYSSSGTYYPALILYMGNFSDTASLLVIITPLVNLGSDTAICEGDVLRLGLNISNASVLWSNGSTENFINITSAGTYRVSVVSGACMVSDTINVSLKPRPILNLGNDTSICDGNKLLLNAKNPGSSYLWQDGSVGQTYLVNKKGSYSVKVTTAGCSFSDSINIKYEHKPFFNLGKEGIYCFGNPLELNPAYPDANYTWQDGSTSSIYDVKQPGLYYVTGTNQCGSFTDSIKIKQGYCHVIVPDAFTPNSDGLNDLFKAIGVELVTEFNMKIYSRWGQVIFETKDKFSGWNGHFNRQLMPVGSYVYAIVYKEQGSSENKFLKGFVTLIR